MHKVSRSLLLAGVLAFGTLTAACGDKVELIQNPNSVGVQSVTVTPQNATIAAGSTIQLASSVVADASTAKTVTWTTSSAAVATVDATGKVTGVGAGTASIIATSTADATKAAAAVITVTGGTNQNTPNTVAISSVTQLGLPANLAAVAGQVDVTLFISGPGGTLNLIQNCTANGATSSVGDVIVAQQQVAGSQNQSPVTLSYNTAATGTISGTPAIAVVNAASNNPLFLNGPCVLKAQLGSATATNVTPLTLANVSRYNVTLAYSGPSAISAVNNLQYNSGDITATITPVNYVNATGLSLISGSFGGAFGTKATFSNVAPAAGTQTFTVVLPSAIVAQGTAVPANSISGWTSPASGDFITITSSVTTGNQPGFVTGGVSTGPIRIDNGPPNLAPNTLAGTPTNPTGAQIVNTTNFVNGSYSFASGVVTPTDSLQNSGTGTNTVTVTIGYAPSTVASLTGNTNYGVPAGSGIGATQCSQTGWTTAATPASIPNSPAGVSTQYRARAFYTDKIGNVRCQDLVGAPGAANANGFFGVDLQAPTLTQTAGPTGGSTSNTPAQNAANGRIVTGTVASFAFQDSISGFVLNRQMRYSLYRNFSAVTANCVPIIDGVNPTQTGSTANGCTGTANSGPNIVLDGNTNVQAYYNLTANAIDQAGNLSNTLSRVYLLDNTVPVVQGISIPQNLTGGVAQTFTSTATDNVDLNSSNFNITYTTATANGLAPAATLYYAGDNYGPNYDATVVTSAAVNATVPFFIKQLQATDAGSAPVPFTAADSGEAQQINVRAIDAANQTSVASVAAIPNINISSSAGFTAGTEFNTFAVTTAAANVANGTGTGTRTATLSAQAVLTSATAQNTTVPFSQVCFFYQQSTTGFGNDATIPAGALVQIGCVNAPSITDVAGVSRTWTYQLTGFDPAAALGTTGVVSIYAVGVKANGVGIISQPNNNLTLVN